MKIDTVVTKERIYFSALGMFFALICRIGLDLFGEAFNSHSLLGVQHALCCRALSLASARLSC